MSEWKMSDNTWITGPIELINHGLAHLKEGKEFDLRIGMISVDNAVELAIKTYLSLHRRELGIKREDLNKSMRNFPALLDAIQNHANQYVSLEELDQIEQFHRLRNSLYHEGNGITVEKKVLEVYAALVNNLISRLFNIEIIDLIKSPDVQFKLIGEFLSNWASLENKLRDISPESKPFPLSILSSLQRQNRISDSFMNKFSVLIKFRNELVYGVGEPSIDELKMALRKLEITQKELEKELST